MGKITVVAVQQLPNRPSGLKLLTHGVVIAREKKIDTGDITPTRTGIRPSLVSTRRVSVVVLRAAQRVRYEALPSPRRKETDALPGTLSRAAGSLPRGVSYGNYSGHHGVHEDGGRVPWDAIVPTFVQRGTKNGVLYVLE